MYDAILSSEDPRFYQHGGVDLIGTSRALLQNVQGGGETQGGSSISQQYVKNILIQRCERDATSSEELLNCWTDATTAAGTEGIQRKLQEMRYAIALEQKYSKNDILLGYLNIANFGGQTYGVDAAAKYYFGVTSKDLTLSQAATLAGIVQNPNTYRIDKPGGSIFDAEDVGYNKAPDGLIDDVDPGQLAALDTLLSDGTITQEQYLAAADGYSATQGTSAVCAEPLARRRQDHAGTVRRGCHRAHHAGHHAREDRLRRRGWLGVLLPVRQEHHQDRPRVRRDCRRPHPHPSAGRAQHLHDAGLRASRSPPNRR